MTPAEISALIGALVAAGGALVVEHLVFRFQRQHEQFERLHADIDAYLNSPESG